jgi:hypothetical protein
MEKCCVEKVLDEYTQKERDRVNIGDLIKLLLEVYSNGDYAIKNLEYYKEKYKKNKLEGKLITIEEKVGAPVEVPAEMPVNPIEEKPKRNHKKKAETIESTIQEDFDSVAEKVGE